MSVRVCACVPARFALALVFFFFFSTDVALKIRPFRAFPCPVGAVARGVGVCEKPGVLLDSRSTRAGLALLSNMVAQR